MENINWLTLITAVVIANAIGFIWYSDKAFGKKWRKLSGISEEKGKEMSKNMTRMFGLMGASSLVMAFVLSVVLSAFGAVTLQSGWTVALWVWFGFVATVMLNSVIYEGKSWLLYTINSLYMLLALVAMASVIVLWG